MLFAILVATLGINSFEFGVNGGEFLFGRESGRRNVWFGFAFFLVLPFAYDDANEEGKQKEKSNTDRGFVGICHDHAFVHHLHRSPFAIDQVERT